ncbi:MAG: hypothetical protein ABI361_01010 [Nitrososphaera sp.]|jgi:hypothetical protein
MEERTERFVRAQLTPATVARLLSRQKPALRISVDAAINEVIDELEKKGGKV